jgi:hypothetical protein
MGRRIGSISRRLAAMISDSLSMKLKDEKIEFAGLWVCHSQAFLP